MSPPFAHQGSFSPLLPPAPKSPSESQEVPPPPEPREGSSPARARRRQRARGGCGRVTELGLREEAPEYQQRPYILSGYRLHTTGCLQCLGSATALHNETVNIWTHLLAMVPVAWWAWGLPGRMAILPKDEDPAGGLWSADWVCLVVLYALTANCLFFSGYYHIRHCDVKSVCYGCFYLDIGGVILLLVGSLGVGVWICFRAFPLIRLAYFTAVMGMLPAMGLSVACHISDEMRAVIFAACAIAGFVPALHWVLVSPFREIAIFVPYLLAVAGTYLTGAVIYGTRFPEKWWPGRFDFFGQSHNLWHMCVFGGMVVWLSAMERMVLVYAGSAPEPANPLGGTVG